LADSNWHFGAGESLCWRSIPWLSLFVVHHLYGQFTVDVARPVDILEL
jgi:hypothetical protein